MSFVLVAVPALLLACVTANLSTARGRPHLDGRIGWPLTLAMLAAATAALMQRLGGVEAAAVALTALMLGIPVVSALIGLRHRKSGPRDA